MLLGILGACGNKKTNIDPFASITKEVDSIRRVADSIHLTTMEIKKRISRSITGSMMTCLPNSIIIRFCLIEKKIWI